MTTQRRRRLEVTSRSGDETRRLGEQLGGLARPGDLYLLIGDLGAGKTTLVQGLAKGLGVEGSTRSPTFTLINEYQGRLRLYHVDLYRVDRMEDAAALGLDDYLFCGEGVMAIEWADRALEVFPEERLNVFMRYVEEETRRIDLEAEGERYEALLAELAAASGLSEVG